MPRAIEIDGTLMKICSSPTCVSAGEFQPVSNFNKGRSKSDGYQRICRKCYSIYSKNYHLLHKSICNAKAKQNYVKNKACILIKCKQRYAENRLNILATGQKKYNELKLEVLTYYSPTKLILCCSWKGCSVNDLDMLTLDHINDDGKCHRKILGAMKIYNWVKKNHFPDGFQTLCGSHQWKKELMRRRGEDYSKYL